MLSDYVVEIEPVKTGRRVTHIELKWWRKDGAGTAETAQHSIDTPDFDRAAALAACPRVAELYA